MSEPNLPLSWKAYLRDNPKWYEPPLFVEDAALAYTYIPKDAPRSSLLFPLRCFNCGFVVNTDKYRTLHEQRWRLSKHECGKSGHQHDPVAYRCFCGESFSTSQALRVHCRQSVHPLPKRFCTEVEVEAMKTLPEGLGLYTNRRVESLSHSDHNPCALDVILTEKYKGRIAKYPDSQALWDAPTSEGLLSYRSPGISPESPSSSGSVRNRRSAHYYNALQGSNTDSLFNTGCVKVYRRYSRSRSPPVTWPPRSNPFEETPTAWPPRPSAA